MTHKKGLSFGCLLLTATVFMILMCPTPVAAFSPVTDGFSGSGNWNLLGSAQVTGGHLVLVPDSANQAGAAVLKQDVRYPFAVDFKAKVSSNGEGMTFMFHHDKTFTPAGGEYLGFSSSSGGVGWGVELDMQNSFNGDSPAPHIGLINEVATSHLKMTSDSSFNDGKWHSFHVEVPSWSLIILKMDGKEIWHMSDYSYKGQTGTGMGFSAASSGTGGSFQVDDFTLSVPGQATVTFWVTFGIIMAIIVFGSFGGIVAYSSSKRKALLKQYGQPGFDYGSVQVPGDLQKQILSNAKASPDPDIRNLLDGFSKASWGMRVALVLMLAAIIGTLFMPAFLVLTLGIVLMVVFIALFAGAAAMTGKGQKPFVVLMGQRMGFFQPQQNAGYQPPVGHQQPPAQPPQYRQSNLPPPQQLSR